MKIVIVINSKIPAIKYGGIERVVWDLGKQLTRFGHHVSFLASEGSTCDFARIIERNEEVPLIKQVPGNTDIVHFHCTPPDNFSFPLVATEHVNDQNQERKYHINTVFLSGDHARRYGSDQFVYNGLDWNEYPAPDLKNNRKHYHFLGMACWRVKNVQGAIDVARAANQELVVMGGDRLNLKKGFRFTPYANIHFKGMIDNQEKADIMNRSKGLIYPVRWHEPFGLSLTESLFFGCPVFGTPYGSLPELVTPEVGKLSDKQNELVAAVKNVNKYSKKRCHEYARDLFNQEVMTRAYLACYERVLNGETLNHKAPQLMGLPHNTDYLPFE